jgi:hypothetical protein
VTGSMSRNEPSREHRKIFARLADVLIPRHGTMPAASEVDVAGHWLDRVLESRPDLTGRLMEVLDEAGDADPQAAILRLERDDPEGFSTLISAAAGGYYMSGEVREQLGYAGQRALPTDATPDEPIVQLVNPVVERGPIYRRVD